MNVLHLGHLFAYIPLMKVIVVDRYCEPAWAVAAAVLAALALDDWRRGDGRRFLPVLISGIISTAVAITGISLASPVIKELLHHLAGKHYPLWLWCSLGWAAVFTVAIALLYLRRPDLVRARWFATLVTINVLCLFSLPPLAGLHAGKPDLGLVSFLQKHIGLERFYTLGPFSPNYGGYFGIASINHNGVPIPANWIHYISATLDPTAVAGNPSLFIGFFPEPFSERKKAVRTHVTGFEDTAVKYVLTPPGVNPFEEMAGSDAPKLVYRGQVADVFELPYPSNYFEAQRGPCELSASSRRFAHPLCKTPATLIRSEPFYPGWRASINGCRTQIRRSASIFQTVPLPAGESKISFSYRPTHIEWAYVAAVIGLILVLNGAQFISARFARRLSPAAPRKDEGFSAAQ